MKRKILAAIIGLTLTLGITACEQNKTAQQKEAQVTREQLNAFLTAQPVPKFAWSQLRQNLIEIETAQASTTATTTFFFNVGVTDPVDVCSSIGFPIPATYQLTASEGKLQDHALTVPQLEANGVYTGDTSGTYVICIDGNGVPYASYWEGFIKTESGPAKWDYDEHKVVLTGAPTGDFSVGK